MEWIIVVVVNFIPTTGEFELQDYRLNPFVSAEKCISYIDNNRQFFIDDTNRSFGRYDKDYKIGCITLETFSEIWQRDIDPIPKKEI